LIVSRDYPGPSAAWAGRHGTIAGLSETPRRSQSEPVRSLMPAALSRRHRDTGHEDKNAPDTTRFLPCADILSACVDLRPAGLRRSLLRLKCSWGFILATGTLLENAVSAVMTGRVPRGHTCVVQLTQHPAELCAMAVYERCLSVCFGERPVLHLAFGNFFRF